jgi:hypothetical protein
MVGRLFGETGASKRRNAESGVMTDEIPYFKIKYAFRTAWSLKETAYLLCGLDPDIATAPIGQNENNKVSLLFFWLSHKEISGNAFPTVSVPKKRKENGRLGDLLQGLFDRFYAPGQFFTWMDADDKKYDEEIYKIVMLPFSKSENSKILSRLHRTLYQHAAKIMWQKYPQLYAPDMAKILTHMPEHLKNKFPIDIPRHTPEAIQEHLKGMSPHGKGARPKTEREDIEVDWVYLVERM